MNHIKHGKLFIRQFYSTYTSLFWLVGVVNPDLRQNAGDFTTGQQKVKSWSATYLIHNGTKINQLFS